MSKVAEKLARKAARKGDGTQARVETEAHKQEIADKAERAANDPVEQVNEPVQAEPEVESEPSSET